MLFDISGYMHKYLHKNDEKCGQPKMQGNTEQYS